MKVLPINNFEVEPWLLEKHYAKRMPQIMFAFGLWLRDRDFFRVEAVVVEAMSSSDWCSIVILGVFDFSWRSAQWALHFFAAASPAL